MERTTEQDNLVVFEMFYKRQMQAVEMLANATGHI